jgi:hypothetical protein
MAGDLGMRRCVLLAACLAACASRDSRVASPVIDTLPGGIITIHNTGPTGWTDSAGAWHLVEVARIEGTADTTSPLIEPGSAALDALGRIVVVDRAPLGIRILNRDGRLIRRFGRQGSGPGEFQNPAISAADSLIIVDDPGVARLEVFDSTGHLLREYPAPCCYFGGSVLNDSGLVFAPTGSADSTKAGAFVRINAWSGATDTLDLEKFGEQKFWFLKTPGGGIRIGVPYSGHELAGFTESGHLLHGWSDRYGWVEQDMRGDTVRIVTRDWTPVKRPEAVRRARFDTMVAGLSRNFGEASVRAALDYGDIPATAEVMLDLEGDAAGRVWVKIFTGDTLHTGYEVFDSSGVLLGQVNAPWPPRERVEWRTASEVLTEGETADGLPMLRVWRLEKVGRDQP